MKPTDSKSFWVALSNACRLADSQIVESRIGRPTLPLRDMLFASVLKVYREVSARELMPELEKAHDSGLITQTPSYNSVQLFLKRERSRQYLLTLIVCCLLPDSQPIKRKHTRVRFASGRKFFGRSYQCLVNEMLCAKVCELVTKAIWYDAADLFEPQRFDGNVDALTAKLNAIIPRWLPPDARDDLFQEMVVAVLDGDVTLDSVQNKVNRYLRKVRAFLPSMKLISLDDDQGGSMRPLRDRLAG